MKRVIICGIITLGLLFLAIGTYFYIVNTTTQALNDVVLVGKALEEEDFETAAEIAKEVNKRWEDFYHHRFLIVDKEYVIEIINALSRMKAMAEIQHDDTIIECAAAEALLAIYLNKQPINVFNVL